MSSDAFYDASMVAGAAALTQPLLHAAAPLSTRYVEIHPPVTNAHATPAPVRVAPAETPVTFKLLLFGDSGVGKTCLFNRCFQLPFDEWVRSTIGDDFGSITLYSHGGMLCKLQIWDTAGQERYRSAFTSYCRGASAVVLLFDITQRASFYAIESDWMPMIRNAAADSPHRATLLVGTKSDLDDLRTVSSEEARAFASTHGMVYLDVSARTNLGVEMLLDSMRTYGGGLGLAFDRRGCS
ncbi:MAG: GTP-binding protein [Methanosarcinales archaeon]|nr:MAG: GTP-binding protein [Methanosarcinales archaeon]